MKLKNMKSIMSENLIQPKEIIKNKEKIYKRIGNMHKGATFLFGFLTFGMIILLQDSNVIPTTSFSTGTSDPSQQLCLDNQFNLYP